MELIQDYFLEYLIDYYLLFLCIVGLALSIKLPYDRVIILIVVIWAALGHYMSAYIYSLKNVWLYWEVFCASIGFLTITSITLLVFFNVKYRTRLTTLISFICLIQLSFHGVAHLDWAILRTDFLTIVLFKFHIEDRYIAYDLYKLVIQLLGLFTVLAIFHNRFISNQGVKKNGVHKFTNNNYIFHARNCRV